MPSKISELRIRNVDAAVLLRLEQQAASKDLSRNAYIKRLLEKTAYYGEIEDSENKYASLVAQVLEYLKINSDSLDRLSSLLDLATNREP